MQTQTPLGKLIEEIKYIACDENDPQAIGTFTTLDGTGMCYVKESTNSGWVSVVDKLPETLEYVLTVNTEGAILVGRLFSHDWKLLFSDGEYDAKDLTVMYWMPLPAPPNNIHS